MHFDSVLCCVLCTLLVYLSSVHYSDAMPGGGRVPLSLDMTS